MVLPSAVNGGVGSQPPALLLQPPKEQRTLLLNEAKLWSELPKLSPSKPQRPMPIDILESQKTTLFPQVPITKEKAAEIPSIPKGKRPDPSTYLDAHYIEKHLSKFKSGATKIFASSPKGVIGGTSGIFVIPSSVADSIIEASGGDVSMLEEMLGFPKILSVRIQLELMFPIQNHYGYQAATSEVQMSIGILVVILQVEYRKQLLIRSPRTII
jgi:hypothetical protein